MPAAKKPTKKRATKKRAKKVAVAPDNGASALVTYPITIVVSEYLHQRLVRLQAELELDTTSDAAHRCVEEGLRNLLRRR